MKSLKINLMLIVIIIIFVALLGFCYLSTPKDVFTEKLDCIKGADNQFIGYSDTNYFEDSYQEKARELLLNKSIAEYRYIFQTFVDEGPKTYMYVKFIGQSGCFTAKMLVNKWDRLEGIKRTNGVSWPSELYDLEWVVEDINGVEELIYVDMHKIID